MESSIYIGFADGSSRHSKHSSSATWVIYTPTGQVLSSGGICLWNVFDADVYLMNDVYLYVILF